MKTKIKTTVVILLVMFLTSCSNNNQLKNEADNKELPVENIFNPVDFNEGWTEKDDYIDSNFANYIQNGLNPDLPYILIPQKLIGLKETETGVLYKITVIKINKDDLEQRADGAIILLMDSNNKSTIIDVQ